MKPLTLILALAILPLAAGQADAAACTVGTGAAVCVAAKTTNPYRSVVIANQSATATVSCTDDGSTPVQGAAGSYDIPPGSTRQWAAANALYAGPFTCIATAAATPVTYTAE